MKALVLFGALAALVAPAAAQASTPDAKALKAVGVKVSWPVGATATEAVGSKLAVKVSSAKRRVELSLVSLDRNGRAVHALARKTLRNGTFTATLGSAATYALRMTVAGKSYASVITVPAPVVPAPPSTPSPFACTGRSTGTTVSMSLDMTTAVAGGALPYRLINTSDGCEMAGAGYDVEQQQPDGTWQSVMPPDSAFTGAGFPLAPGQPLAKQAQVPAGLAPGPYRLRDSVSGYNPDPLGNPYGGQLVMTAPFTVVA